jgi:AcrR family transcriptional regulator
MQQSSPGQHVLVDAVHQRPVQVEQERRPRALQRRIRLHPALLPLTPQCLRARGPRVVRIALVGAAEPGPQSASAAAEAAAFNPEQGRFAGHLSLIVEIQTVQYHNYVTQGNQDRSSRNSGGGAGAPDGAQRGRPRSDRAHRAILDATRELLIEGGFADLRLEHVAARAGVGKATIYRRWPSKETLALDLLMELAGPHIAIRETGDTREELLAAVTNAMGALTDTPFGPAIRALLSQIASNPLLGDPFRSSVVRARREEVARVIARGVGRGDLRPDVDVDIATELLVGPVYFRLMFGGELTQAFAERVVDAVLHGYAARSPTEGAPPPHRSASRRSPTARPRSRASAK